jgi:cysteine desulfurase family protein
MRKVYLDNGSTSFPKAPGVAEAMSHFITEVGCNISRGGYETAYDLGDTIFETRSMLCRMFNFSEEKYVVFTPSVTYSLNFVIKGLLKSGDHVIMSSMEHNAVARPCQSLKDFGVEVTIVPCDRDGVLDIDAFKNSFKENTKLVVMSHASNVCGTVLDAEEVGKICKEKGVFFALDAAQSAGVINIDFEKFNLSALCLTGHKGLLGPQGTGALLLRHELAEALDPVISGGTGSASHLLTMPEFMPDKFEAGTLNLPGIIGLNASLEYIRRVGIDTIFETEKQLAQLFIEEIDKLPNVKIIGVRDWNKRVGTVSLDFESIDNAEVSFILDSEYGIMTRCGLHCAPLAHQTLGTYPQGTVRFAFGHKNTEEDVEYAVSAIRKILGCESPEICCG